MNLVFFFQYNIYKYLFYQQYYKINYKSFIIFSTFSSEIYYLIQFILLNKLKSINYLDNF